MKNKRGQGIIVENVVFILLNVLFLVLVGTFVFRQLSSAHFLEETYAKNIALLIDSTKPITEMTLRMNDAFELAEKNNIPRNDIVKISGNNVEVKLSSKGGYKYSFFNTVDVSVYPDSYPNNQYIIKINRYNV